MIPVRAFSSYRRQVLENEGLPDLDPILRPLCREHFRRIDRFIQLALLGSGSCAQAAPLDAECGLYVGTSYGPISSNITVQEALFKQRLLPKPFNFVNTLGSSTGYFLSKNLGLKGQALFISRRPGPLDAALICATADLESGIISQALVGLVEEVTLPLDEHRRRIGIKAEEAVFEESSWLFLDKNADASVTLNDLKSLSEPLGSSALQRLKFR